MKNLVTGGAGFLGTHLSPSYSREGNPFACWKDRGRWGSSAAGQDRTGFQRHPGSCHGAEGHHGVQLCLPPGRGPNLWRRDRQESTRLTIWERSM